MNVLVLTHFMNGILMILMPVGLGVYLARRFRFGWRLWWIGAGTFVLSQVGHIPFNLLLGALFQRGMLPTPPVEYQLVFSALVLGLSAGLWEEGARYLSYRYWANDARTWPQGLMLGAGHGGIEAILLGVLVFITYIGMLAVDWIKISPLLSPDQAALLQEQVSVYWSLPWYYTLLGALERLSTLCFHLAASVLVLQVFVRKQIRWLWLAIGLHTLFNAIAVYAVSTWGPYMAETLLAVMAIISLTIIFWLRPAELDEINPGCIVSSCAASIDKKAGGRASGYSRDV